MAVMPERVVIVGAGQAGAQVAVSLRQLGYGGDITLLGEERQLPYQRPPLSKAYLSGEMALERTWLRSESYYAVRPGAVAVIIGGGYIGLEVAASLRKLGCAVAVVEALERVMNRVVAPPVSAFFAAEHARRGVEIVTGAAVASLEADAHVARVVCTDGRAFAADLVVIGIGAVPNDELARDAGLEVENGVMVDAFGRTSDPAIFAAGDVTNHPNALFARRLRLESVHNAMEQAKAVARTIAGEPQPYTDVPWFWSDQYDLKLQIAGVGDPDDELILRGDPATRAFSCLHLRQDRLVAIDCVNRGGDFLAAKKLIGIRSVVERSRAADPELPLSEATAEAPGAAGR
jgi:3-phenylpropionate/trans-cinnamate dioxygenase ferredoxin reductase component